MYKSIPLKLNSLVQKKPNKKHVKTLEIWNCRERKKVNLKMIYMYNNVYYQGLI